MALSSPNQVFCYFVLILLVQSWNEVRTDQRRAVKAVQAVRTRPNALERSILVDPTPDDETTNESVTVEYGDSIYLKGDWDASPVVLESHKLVFFTQAKVSCTTWKMLFRRMMGKENWNLEMWDGELLPWNPETNGLKYLYDFDREKATEIMTSPNWTRAIFVRDPKERFLSAFLDKVIHHKTYLRDKCCYYNGQCVEKARASLAGFLKVAYFCDDAHWRSQNRRMEDKYWPFLDFVGHMETLQEDAESLLRQIGAWEEFGATGWGPAGDEYIFQAKSGGIGRQHATNARKKLQEYMTPEVEEMVDEFYSHDYTNPKLGLKKLDVFGQPPEE